MCFIIIDYDVKNNFFQSLHWVKYQVLLTQG